MKRMVDVINFNADASCLSSIEWLRILEGASESKFCKWLNLYVEKKKMVVLGLPGATISDLVSFNPEAIRLINDNPDIFEIILRPFAHDVGLLRQGIGFETNFIYGQKIILKEFSNITNYFLPPEFMATNDQIYKMKKMGVKGIFSNPSRFSSEIKDRLPKTPFKLKGFDDTQMECIPFEEGLTKKYLWAIQQFDCSPWNLHIAESSKETVYSWRDGESLFFLPNGIKREEYWLSNESESVQRSHLKSSAIKTTANEDLIEHQFHAYPIHSCLSWMREFRLLGFINKIMKIENRLDELSKEEIHRWLLVINSDIMSSIEKISPIVNLKTSPTSDDYINHKIYRSERWFEGEEYLMRLEKFDLTLGAKISNRESSSPHMIKMTSRLAYLNVIE